MKRIGITTVVAAACLPTSTAATAELPVASSGSSTTTAITVGLLSEATYSS